MVYVPQAAPVVPAAQSIGLTDHYRYRSTVQRKVRSRIDVLQPPNFAGRIRDLQRFRRKLRQCRHAVRRPRNQDR